MILFGVVMYLMLFTNLIGLVSWLGRKLFWRDKLFKNMINKVTGIIAILVTLCVSGYGIAHAQYILVKPYQVTLKTTQKDAKPLRITLISDLHIGYVTGNNRLEEIVKKVNATKPDIILIAGDVFDGNDAALNQPERTSAVLRQLQAKDGVYACLGNHDSGKDFNLFLKTLTQGNVELLNDTDKTIAGEFVLAGRRDSRPIYNDVPKREPLEVLDSSQQKLPIIVMDHQPSNYHDYVGKKNELILSGHTHNGQLWPGNLIVKNMYPSAYGYYRENSNSPQMIVTSGVGTWGPPLRVASDNEIAVIDVKFKKE
jgi:predicted MPP superfamily phosphohydrolase